MSTRRPTSLRPFAHAAQQGAEAIATHLRDHAEILALVASRERDVGGEA